jgi:hypothetical protein
MVQTKKTALNSIFMQAIGKNKYFSSYFFHLLKTWKTNLMNGQFLNKLWPMLYIQEFVHTFTGKKFTNYYYYTIIISIITIIIIIIQ